MKNNEAVIKFEEYIVEKMSYNINKYFDPIENKSLEIEFNFESEVYLYDDFFSISLYTLVGEESNNQCPFLIDVEMIGVFTYNGMSLKEIENFIPNGLAVLFPYLRSLVSDLSARSNTFPVYRLPLLNLISYMENEEKIKIYDKRIDSEASD